MKNIVFIIITVLAIVSCKNNSNKHVLYKAFPHEYVLSHQDIATPPVLYFVAEILLLDDYLITVDIKADTFFRVFNYPSMDYVGWHTLRGAGPNEEIFINPFIKKLTKNRFMYQTYNTVKIADIEKDRHALKLVNRIPIPGKLMDIEHVFIIDNKLYGSDLLNSRQNEFVCYDPQSKLINEFGPPFPEYNTKVPSAYNSIYAKAVEVKPDYTLFASVYDKFPILRIYSIDGTLKNEVRFDNNQRFPYGLIKNNASKEEINIVVQNYRKIKTTDRYIYALYVGKTNAEIDYENVGLTDFSNEIHVWDWDGNPVSRLLLDKSIFSFCVTRDDNYLLCNSVNVIDKLYKYQIPWEE